MRSFAIGGLVVAMTSSAIADSAGDAAAAASAAQTLASQHSYIEAAAKFRVAYHLDPSAEYLCDIGVAYQRAKDLPKAHIYLAECLVRGSSLDPKFIALVRDALATTEEKLRAGDFAPIEVTVAPESARIALTDFDADEIFLGSRVFWLPFGHHDITVGSSGYVDQHRALEITSRAERRERFELAKPIAVVDHTPLPPESPSKTPAIVATIATVGLGVAATAFWLDARHIMSGADATGLTHDQYDQIVDRANQRQYVAWGLGAFTGVAAIASSYLWYRATRSLELVPTTNGVAMVGTW